MPFSDTFLENNHTVRKPHTNMVRPSDIAHFVHSRLNIQYTVYYLCSQGKNSRSLGFSSCICPFQLPPHCFPSCSRPVFSSPLCFSFAFRSLFLSNFFLLIRHSSRSYLLPPHTQISLFSVAFSKDVTWWVTDSSCAEDCVAAPLISIKQFNVCLLLKKMILPCR
ncbi:hypothetical protein ILYODFUR_019879 [Ilyodon furcidens]|uniref:Uncharacterized protein n=1 Tax=Ilyodon furcidens TaxID=33524 RepID=A0ABV0TBW7_9TELE